MNLNLIRDLNAEHAVLSEALARIEAEGALTDAAKRMLANARSALLAHLEREEREFYPVMRKAAETNESLRSTLASMGVEMQGISARTLDLIDHWIAGKGSDTFATDVRALRDSLGDRIRREEHSLYAKYIKLAR